MEVINGLESFPTQRGPVVVALGTFDGVHLGHQALIHYALRRAREIGGRCVVLTFDPHPLQVIAPPSEPFLLTSLRERLHLLADLGADLAVIVRFDAALRQISADRWIETLVTSTRLSETVCGPNYTFGYDRTGNVAVLMRRGRERGFAVHVVPPVELDGIIVSSTEIRTLLREGDVRRAAKLLGRWFSNGGEVIQGDGRGAALGFPTANLQPPHDKIIPMSGIYAAFARIPAGVRSAAVSIGTRPTFGPGRLVIEAHLIDASEDLYGAPIDLFYVERLRDEMKFNSVNELVAQMREDVEDVRRILKETTEVTARP